VGLSPLRILLLLTGLPFVGLLALLFIVREIPGVLGVVYGAVSASLGFSLSAVLAYALVKLFREDFKRGKVRFDKVRVSKCAICGEVLPEVSVREVRRGHGPHYESVHPGEWRWDLKWGRGLTVVFTGFSFVLFGFSTYLLVIGSFVESAILYLFCLVSLFSAIRIRKVILWQFRKAWKKQHPDEAAPASRSEKFHPIPNL